MYRSRLFALVVAALIPLCAFSQQLSKTEAVSHAETFIAENGYLDLPEAMLKIDLDLESIEWSSGRKAILASRFNSLKSKAIGIRKGAPGRQDGWSVAFDYVDQASFSSDRCRVVTMRPDGTGIRLEHVDGVRTAFAGFSGY